MSNAHRDSPSDNRSPSYSPFVVVPEKIYKQSKTLIHHDPNLVRKQKAIREQAKTLDDLKWIYALYGALDGLSSSFSMLKYFFDFYYTNSPLSSDVVLHDWSLTPEGMLVIAIESAALMWFAVAGNYCDDDIKSARTFTEAQEKLKDYPFFRWLTGLMAYLWPYFRDAMKAIKNGGKSIRNAISFAELLSFSHHLRSIMMPLTVVFGVISACNRVWLRSIREQRKIDKQTNKRLLQAITQQLADLSEQLRVFEQQSITDETQWNTLKTTINTGIQARQAELARQLASQSSWWLSDLSAGFNGLMDTPYLLFGVLSVAVLAPGSFFFAYVAGCTLFLGVICVITRIYEEHNFQREFRVQQLEIELNQQILSLIVLFSELNAVSFALATQPVSDLFVGRQNETKHALGVALDACLSSREALKKQSDLSLGWVLLGGFKNGIDAYSAVASLIFVVATIDVLLGITYSPLLLVGFVSCGMLSVLCCVTYSLIDYCYYLSNKLEYDGTVPLHTAVAEMKAQLEDSTNMEIDTMSTCQSVVLEALRVDSPPQFFFLEWFEVIRLFFSGGGKGVRTVDSLFPSLQDMGKDGHYHDNPTMIFFACVDALLFAFVFALRGFARLSKMTIDEDEDVSLCQQHDVTDTIRPQLSRDESRSSRGSNNSLNTMSRSPSFFNPLSPDRILSPFPFRSNSSVRDISRGVTL